MFNAISKKASLVKAKYLIEMLKGEKYDDPHAQ